MLPHSLNIGRVLPVAGVQVTSQAPEVVENFQTVRTRVESASAGVVGLTVVA